MLLYLFVFISFFVDNGSCLDLRLHVKDFGFEPKEFIGCTGSKSLEKKLLYDNPTENYKNPKAIRHFFGSLQTYKATYKRDQTKSLDGFNDLIVKLFPEGKSPLIKLQTNTSLTFNEDNSYLYVIALADGEVIKGTNHSLGIFSYNFGDNIITSQYNDEIPNNPRIGDIIIPNRACIGVGDTVKVGPFRKDEKIGFFWIRHFTGALEWDSIYPSFFHDGIKSKDNGKRQGCTLIGNDYDIFFCAFEDSKVDGDTNELQFTFVVEGSASLSQLSIAEKSYACRETSSGLYRNAHLLVNQRERFYSLKATTEGIESDKIDVFYTIPKGWTYAYFSESLNGSFLEEVRKDTSGSFDSKACFVFNTFTGIEGIKQVGFEMNGEACEPKVSKMVEGSTECFQTGKNQYIVLTYGNEVEIDTPIFVDDSLLPKDYKMVVKNVLSFGDDVPVIVPVKNKCLKDVLRFEIELTEEDLDEIDGREGDSIEFLLYSTVNSGCTIDQEVELSTLGPDSCRSGEAKLSSRSDEYNVYVRIKLQTITCKLKWIVPVAVVGGLAAIAGMGTAGFFIHRKLRNNKVEEE